MPENHHIRSLFTATEVPEAIVGMCNSHTQKLACYVVVCELSEWLPYGYTMDKPYSGSLIA